MARRCTCLCGAQMLRWGANMSFQHTAPALAIVAAPPPLGARGPSTNAVASSRLMCTSFVPPTPKPRSSRWQLILAAAAAATAGGAIADTWLRDRRSDVRGDRMRAFAEAPAPTPDSHAAAADGLEDSGRLRLIRRAEVEKHKTAETGIWVTYKEGVYDITEFVSAHPGGVARIMLAAGGPVEPYWAMYAQHKHPQVFELLEELRIGTLPEEERAVAESADPYASDPARDPAMRVLSSAPFNGEAPESALRSYITPTALHFTRHHLPVPHVVPAAYELSIAGSAGGGAALTLADLASFPKHDVTVTLQCAGNRRSEMAAVRSVRGLSWGGAAVSTAVWSGARLRDVLLAHGVKPGPDARHVEFIGLDCDMEGNRYAASIPIEKAMAEDGDVILAYEMNGEAIPRDHGYPVRVVVPGVVAARSIKWVEKIVVRPDESDVLWQQKDYKGFCPDEDWDNLDWSKAPSIQETPITSAILSPCAGDKVPAGAETIHMEGYAVSGGGRAVIRVDVSIDGGKSWRAADLEPMPEDQQAYHRAWAWRHWKADMPLPRPAEKGSTVEIVCKAVDDSYNVQPDSFAPIYNARGVLANAWHRVALTVSL